MTMMTMMEDQRREKLTIEINNVNKNSATTRWNYAAQSDSETTPPTILHHVSNNEDVLQQ